MTTDCCAGYDRAFSDIFATFPANALRACEGGQLSCLRLEFDSHDEGDGTIRGADSDGAPLFEGRIASFLSAIPCLTAEVSVATREGARAIGDLAPGAQVMTRDNGLQTLRWIGARRFDGGCLALNPLLRPIRIAAGALGAGLPLRDLTVSPNHRMLTPGPGGEARVAARDLVGLDGVAIVDAPEGVTYLQLLFDRPEMLLCDGVWTESFDPTPVALAAFDAAQRAELLALRGDLLAQDAEAAGLPVEG